MKCEGKVVVKITLNRLRTSTTTNGVHQHSRHLPGDFGRHAVKKIIRELVDYCPSLEE